MAGARRTWTGRRCRHTRPRCWRPGGRWLWRWTYCQSSGVTEPSGGTSPAEDPGSGRNSSLGCWESLGGLRQTHSGIIFSLIKRQAMQTVKNKHITLERNRVYSHVLSLRLWKQADTHLDRCCCWPHLLRFQCLHSVLPPQQCAALPGRCWSGRVLQDTNLSGTGPTVKLSQWT